MLENVIDERREYSDYDVETALREMEGLVRSIGSKFSRPGTFTYEDMLQAGRVAIIEHFPEYDRVHKPSVFFYPHIMNGVIDCFDDATGKTRYYGYMEGRIRKARLEAEAEGKTGEEADRAAAEKAGISVKRLRKIERDSGSEVSIEEIEDEPGYMCVEEEVMERIRNRTLMSILNRLPKGEKTVITMKFGFYDRKYNPGMRTMKIREIREELERLGENMNPEREYRRGMEKLRKMVEREGV